MFHFRVPFVSLLAGAICLLPSLVHAADKPGEATVETWHVWERSFKATQAETADVARTPVLDVDFIHLNSGTRLRRPAFWDGGNTFRVRFAPTRAGVWNYRTTCRQDKALNDLTGSINAVPARGPLELYRRGFVRVKPGQKYFTYADGTPFFYLGDTHWGLYREELDAPGPFAGKSGATSHVKHLIARRVAQGFTVYQSEPVDAPFNLQDGRVDAADLPGLQLADRYYQAIANAGLVHANAELFFSTLLRPPLMNDRPALERLTRHWVARFGAYPVMWTLAQEVDNDLYQERGDHHFYTFQNNPWVTVAEFIHKYDAYHHPLSGHQENAFFTTVTGRGTTFRGRAKSNNGTSVFLDDAVTRRTGHNWWATQWQPRLTAPINWDVPRDYYASPKPAVLFEGRYCYLWTKDFGARAQGWIGFLNGFCGYGYGAADIWLYKSTYDMKSTSHDGCEPITAADKATPWSTAVEFPSAHQMTYLKKFLTALPWWQLKPDLGSGKAFTPASQGFGCCASLGNRLYIVYLNGRNTVTGTLHGLAADRPYNLTWFNPRTGQSLAPQPLKVEPSGDAALPPKPDAQDWVLKVTTRGQTP